MSAAQRGVRQRDLRIKFRRPLTGRNTYDDPVAGRFLLLIGYFREVFDPDFNILEPLGGRGQMVDLCEALA